MSEQFPELKSSGGRKKFKLDWSIYAKKKKNRFKNFNRC